MVIIFYDANREKIYLCTDREKMQTISIDDPNLMSHIPNDDIMYVQNANFITKNQFEKWINGEMEFQTTTDTHKHEEYHEEEIQPTKQDKTLSQYSNSKWIHPAHNGTIMIEDIKTKQFPDGIILNGKWDFFPVDAIGGFDVIEESHHYRFLLAKGKIKVVNYEYVKKNQGKKKRVSLADAALDAILVKDDKRGSADAVAASGGIGSSDESIEILIEGDI